MARITEKNLQACPVLPDLLLVIRIIKGGRNAFPLYPEGHKLSSHSIETNFADPDVLELAKIYKRVDGERVHLMQFVRFQKAADGTFFAAVEPQFNALPLAVDHFKDRFADQRWLIYDVKRQYGYYYNLTEMEEVTFEDPRQAHLVTGMLNETLMDNDEKLFQKLWKTYFKSICIKERWNPRKHRQDMPVRYWKYLTEKQ